jgi:hypothetical protein
MVRAFPSCITKFIDINKSIHSIRRFQSDAVIAKQFLLIELAAFKKYHEISNLFIHHRPLSSSTIIINDAGINYFSSFNQNISLGLSNHYNWGSRAGWNLF